MPALLALMPVMPALTSLNPLNLIAFELAAKFSRRRENPVQPRLCNAKNAIFKTAQNGGFPSVAIFAGQLEHNKLYAYAALTRYACAGLGKMEYTTACMCMYVVRIYECIYVCMHACMHVYMHVFTFVLVWV